MELGSCVSHENRIRVHPCLHQAFVPRQYVAWVVFHELEPDRTEVAFRSAAGMALWMP